MQLQAQLPVRCGAGAGAILGGRKRSATGRMSAAEGNCAHKRNTWYRQNGSGGLANAGALGPSG
eukprot:3126912-Alexandrium_andersonii.AAC.1